MYGRAPVQEASIGIQVFKAPEIELKAIVSLSDRFSEQFPGIAPLDRTEVRLDVESRTSSVQPAAQFGFRLQNPGADRVVQITVDSFAYSVLQPYPGWTEFRDQAKRLWEQFDSICQPEGVVRVGIRYIDRFDLPATATSVRDHLTVFPSIPPDLPTGTINGYFMQLQLPQPDIDCMLVMNTALVPPAKPDVTSVILDCDVFRSPWTGGLDHTIWEFLEIAHQRQDAVFEASITERARELIR